MWDQVFRMINFVIFLLAGCGSAGDDVQLVARVRRPATLGRTPEHLRPSGSGKELPKLE